MVFINKVLNYYSSKLPFKFHWSVSLIYTQNINRTSFEFLGQIDTNLFSSKWTNGR